MLSVQKKVTIFYFVALFLFAVEFYLTTSTLVPFRASYFPPIGDKIFSIVERNDPVNFSEQ